MSDKSRCTGGSRGVHRLEQAIDGLTEGRWARCGWAPGVARDPDSRRGLAPAMILPLASIGRGELAGPAGTSTTSTRGTPGSSRTRLRQGRRRPRRAPRSPATSCGRQRRPDRLFAEARRARPFDAPAPQLSRPPARSASGASATSISLLNVEGSTASPGRPERWWSGACRGPPLFMRAARGRAPGNSLGVSGQQSSRARCRSLLRRHRQ